MKTLRSITYLLFSAFLFLAACGQGGSSQPDSTSLNSGDNFASPLPARLQKVFNNGTLSAEIVVDGGTPVPLTVDLTANRVSGSVANLSPGNHTFVINYFITPTAGGAKVIVATATTTGAITAGASTAISFAQNAITYPDNDNDGFTNLAEIESGTNPNDAASRPPAESPRRSANYVMADVIGTSPVVGVTSSTDYKIATTAPSGKSTSANYTLGP